MKLFKVALVCVLFGLLAGCQTAKKQHIVEKDSASTLVTPGEDAIEETTEGKASKEDIAKAIKDEPIPATRIPEDSHFIAPAEISEEMAQIFKNIPFDFDSYAIQPNARPIINTIGKYLLENAEVIVMIEGHCDERGTREYNLVLGEQRALSVRRFLVSLGVASDRLYTVSYGKDKPLDTASNEDVWAKNRRAEFKIAK